MHPDDTASAIRLGEFILFLVVSIVLTVLAFRVQNMTLFRRLSVRALSLTLLFTATVLFVGLLAATNVTALALAAWVGGTAIALTLHLYGVIQARTR